jgi:aspartate-semialdehyde dehydrogenase
MKKIGIIGATGVVGQEMINCLYDRNFPMSELRLFASARSAGKKVSTPKGELTIEEFSVEEAKKSDIVLMAVSGSFAKEYAPQITEGDAIVIDNSSAFRMDNDKPLVVPEVNAKDLKNAKIIANPNCTTAILAVALYPIYKEFGLKKTIVSTYQATSGAGYEAMMELENETRNYLEGKEVSCDKFPSPIPFNLIPRIDIMTDNNYSKEEMKVVNETRKIFHNSELQISCTAVRIPTFRAHAESVTIETERPINPEKVRDILKNAKGVEVIDDPKNWQFPMPLTASKKYNVEIGRIRQNIIFNEYGLDFFVCGDQLLKGAALNAVQIAENIV